MDLRTPGIHHVTAIGSDPGANRRFYTETLGLRLVKRSVNQDDTSVYHLFYGDRSGSPGTSMTVFPYPGARQGQVGIGQASTVGFAIPAGSVDYWLDRLDQQGVEHEAPVERFGDTVIGLRDPDGIHLELVATDDVPPADPPEGPVPAAHAIRGFFGVTLLLADARSTASLLDGMGFRETAENESRRRFAAEGDRGAVLDLQEAPDRGRGQPGAGTIHHVAFRVTEATQPAWREMLIDRGLRPTEIIDRTWFKSVYARTPGGVLFEFATETPGYTVDEEPAELGSSLVLPEFLEDRRAEIEAELPDLRDEPSQQ
jgi:glyoxalase family protein